MARRSWAMCSPKSRIVVSVVLRSFIGVPLIIYGRITRQREKNRRKSDMKNNIAFYFDKWTYQNVGIYYSWVGEREKALVLSCNIRLWVVLLLPEVLWCASLSIASRSAIVLQMACYLSQLLCRVFASHLCALHARASQQFCTFCFHNLHRKGLSKRRSFLGKSSDVYLFFSEFFSKMLDVFTGFFPRFWEFAAVCKQGCSVKVVFPLFFLLKNPSFQHSCVKVVKAKKCKSQGTRACVTCTREKVIFSEQSMMPYKRASSTWNSPDFSLPFCALLAEKMNYGFSDETGWRSLLPLRRKSVFGLFCKV